MKTKTMMSSKIAKLKQEEMETIISFDLVAKKWVAWTTIKKDMTKLKRQKWTLIKTDCYSDGTVYAMQFEAPENAITFRTVTESGEVKKRNANPNKIEK